MQDGHIHFREIARVNFTFQKGESAEEVSVKKEGESGWVNSGGSSALLREVWSVEGHFVPCLIFVFTWHGRKLTTRGASHYCLINTETKRSHLLLHIRSKYIRTVGVPRSLSVPSQQQQVCIVNNSTLFVSEKICKNEAVTWKFVVFLNCRCLKLKMVFFLSMSNKDWFIHFIHTV